ncbi:unnamed protein product [Blepharisma stoltei]|uniref:Peptidase S11 D-alanyl-D-alanine carboxypeptidase A N-terminal domain-containing protein n=1 Tax=Blepharisma stoltei TaxID=1481888 RepID=A0AAU9K6N6_9CILI|nr:unnamed protein product [Blepharisma stoltei]
MNDFAKELNLENTVFKNPHGLSIKPNFSTVRDVCKLAAFSLKNQFFCLIVNTQSYSCIIENPNGNRSITWKTTNKLLGKGFDGIKTGHTIKAGPCLCVRTNSSNPQLIVTVLGCKSYESRWVEVPKIASWAQKRFL